MITLPAAFEERMKKQLGGEASLLEEALRTEPPVSIRLNPGKVPPSFTSFPGSSSAIPVPWCDNAYYLKERPVFTLDPYLHGGVYYVQEASSMFLHHILKQLLPSGPIKMLDLCAAPGGKSTLSASLLHPDSLLISNEVIRSRANILKENIQKWGQTNMIVTNNDPSDFSAFEGAFDIILVDAPCSGEGMFRKDPGAIQEWSEANLRLCSERQQRILSDIWPCLKPDGYLIYSTCTYNPGENEEILKWLLHNYQARSVPINHSFDAIFSASSSIHSYQFYPHKTVGEGFFTGVIQKQDGQLYAPKRIKKTATVKQLTLPDDIRPLLGETGAYEVYQSEDNIGILPALHADFINHLEKNLRVLYKGCEIAAIHQRKLKLLPAFALWQGLQQSQCTVYEVDRHTALTFLKKEDIPVPKSGGDWILITYQGIGLGWCKNLGTRLNNYYPKEWRIRMSLDISPDNKSKY